MGLIGLADDTGVGLNGGRKGAAGGPTAFRRALAGYGVALPAWGNYPGVFDAGDVLPAAGGDADALAQTHQRVMEATTQLLEAGLFPIAIGGGHDLTYPFVRAVVEYSRRGGASPNWHGVYADAHLDVRESVGSGMPFRSIIETCKPNSLSVYGLSGAVNSREHLEYFNRSGGRVLGSARAEAFAAIADQDRVFCSIDLDSMNVAHAPGVSAINPGGLTSREVEELLETVARRPGLACLDFMELNPVFDGDGRTARLAAHLFLSFLRALRSSWDGAGSVGVKEGAEVGVKFPLGNPPTCIIINARVLTLSPGGAAGFGSGNVSSGKPVVARRGKAEMNDLGIVSNGRMIMRGGMIESIEAIEFNGAGKSTGGTMKAGMEEGQRIAAQYPGASIFNAMGRVVMPGFVDCHTHACFAGNRLDEWTQRLNGATYLDILRGGGGIMSTVRAVQTASEAELLQGLRDRLARLGWPEGTSTIEVKSGYGLTTRDELKMLRAISSAGANIRATALLGHAIDAQETGFVERVIHETLPAVHAEFPGVAVDAFCEQAAWSLQNCRDLFERAMELGHPCRVHADQFTEMGMTAWGAAKGFVSVDHLEATGEAGLEALAATVTVGVGLPVCGLHLSDHRYAPLRRLVDLGGACAIATNFNPGSAFSLSMPLAMGLAVRNCGLTVAEAIIAATVNGAAVLGGDCRVRLAPGYPGDFIVLTHTDERDLAYQMGGQHIAAAFRGGVRVF